MSIFTARHVHLHRLTEWQGSGQIGGETPNESRIEKRGYFLDSSQQKWAFLCYSTCFCHVFRKKGLTFASSKAKDKRSFRIQKKDNRLLTKEKKGKRIMTLTYSIAFAIVAIAAIVSNASVFANRLD